MAMNSKQLKQRYSEAVRYLDDNYAYFLTHVLKIGKPQWNGIVPTAAVKLELEGTFSKSDELDYDNFDFVFNPKFAEELDTPAFAFILAHETMHILLNHLKLSGDFVDRERAMELSKRFTKGDRLSKDELKELFEQQQNGMKFNIAADCVINDYLVQAGMPAPLRDGKTMLMRGKDKVGQDCANLTVHEVYELLDAQMKQKPQCPTCNGSGKKPKEDKKDEKGKKDDKGDKGKEEGGKDKSDQKGQGEDQEGAEGEGDQDGDDGKPGGESGHGGGDEPCPDCQGSGKGKGEGMPGADGQPGGGNGGVTYEQLDSHDWMLDPEYADKLADAIDKLYDEVEQKGNMPADLEDKKTEEDGQQTAAQQQLQNSMKAGTEAGNVNEFIEQSGVELAYAKLLKEIDPDIFKEPGLAPPMTASFHQRRRKLNSQAFKGTYLPVHRREERREKLTNEIPSIVLALDVSGSIGPRDANRFITLARSIPQERIKLFCCLFDTRYIPVPDLQNPPGPTMGGTDFNAVIDYIEREVKPELKGQYPKSVVVITDGQASLTRPPSEDEAKGWLWLISPVDRGDSYYTASQTIGRRAMLDEYIA